MSKDETLRISFDLDKSVNDRITHHMHHGMKAETFRKISALLADALDKHGMTFVLLLEDGQIEFGVKNGKN